jgi:hypothetical protein
MNACAPHRSSTMVILRSGRHLACALEALHSSGFGGRIVVVSQPGTEPSLEAAGVGPGERLIYDRRRTFSARAFLTSPAGRAVRATRFDSLAVLWTEPHGRGFENVNRTALALSPRGFLAITPDGVIRQVRPWRVASREVMRCAWSMTALAVLSVGVLLPALVLKAVKR